ncbi:UNVERIFIED_CONTAM: Retrovirus-related Pol polyprotein from transposon RE1 [Sesamum latifolium]|uniref:Retrovirus-related Pol polyprotein from transposon RE1 n=1 Tax=Sesamum latifolium TaxID=2727402 RepID=A0AAW2XWI9_9LAMI
MALVLESLVLTLCEDDGLGEEDDAASSLVAADSSLVADNTAEREGRVFKQSSSSYSLSEFTGSLLLKVSEPFPNFILHCAIGMAVENTGTMVQVAAMEKNRRDSDLEFSGMIFVSSPLNGDNYLVWSRAMRFALGSRMKLSFIDGRSVRPSDDSPELDEWIRKDYLVITWILNNVSKTIVDAFMYVNSGRSMWLELEARYGKSNGPMIYNLEREISSITQGDLSITEYYTKIRKLWDEIACLDPPPVCTCTAHRGTVAREASHQLMQFLMGLSTPFANVRSQILVMDPRPDVAKAFAMLLNVKKELQAKPYVDKRGVFCEHCQKTGHAKETCFKLHGTPGWYKDLTDKKRKGRGRGRGSFAAAVGFTAAPSHTVPNTETNLSDILRTELKKLLKEESTSVDRQRTPLDMVHINFAEVDEFADNTKVHLPDGSARTVANIGSIQLPSNITLEHDQRTKKRLAIGKLIGKLYILDDSSFSVQNNCLASIPLSISHTIDSNCNDSLWHQRLGHSSYQAIKHIAELQIKQAHSASPCHICHLSKQHRLSFPLSDTQVDHIFYLVHMDIWGPYKTATVSGCLYFLTIVDHFSRNTWIYLLKFKSQAVDHITSFPTMVDTQFHYKVKVIRTDNGAEFLSTQCQTLFQNQCILHQHTSSYTPQQNGIAEHKHKHLLAVARALLFQASLPERFWGDCVLTATYIINQTPHILAWSTPYELLFGKSPMYSHMKVFGCLCYATNVNPYKTKFSPRASRCVFLGYVSGQKGYKVYDLSVHSYFVSRDVVLYESIFPFASGDPALQTSDPVLLMPRSENDSYISTLPTTDDPTSLPHIFPDPTPHISPASLISEPIPTGPRRSTRTSVKPSWQTDFYCHTNSTTPSYTFPGLSSAYTCFVASLSALQEPRSYREAAASKEWREAMNAEILALGRNQTWEITQVPPGKRAIGCKWVFRSKLKTDGTVDRYKARLVAKGYTQVEGVDYVESFSPVAKPVTVRLLLAIAAARNWEIHQLDVNNAFLHGRLDEEIFMTPPEGYQVAPGSVCRLTRSLYGLKQASQQWNQEFTSQLLRFGFSQSSYDHCLFTMGSDQAFLALLVYVDDVLMVGPSIELIGSVKQYLDGLFTIKDLGTARYFLGLQIARSSAGLSLTQSKYIHDILTNIGLLAAKSVTSPLPQGVKLSSDSGSLLKHIYD